MTKNRGFVTIATGDEHYYKTAVNLLLSYKCFTTNKLPFAIIADRENKYTALFDKVILLKNPHFSYMDKIELLNNVPYDETVFVEADCLAYTDLNAYFDMFINSDDFSAFDYSIPVSDSSGAGWFKLEESGKYRSEVKYYQGIHSGVIFLRNTETCKKIYDICQDIWKNYDKYNIGGNMDMLDDKLLTLSSSVIPCKMTACNNPEYEPFLVYPSSVNNRHHPKTKIIKGLATETINGKVIKCIICHWGNKRTKRTLYKREVSAVNFMLNKNVKNRFCLAYYNFILPFSFLKLRFLKAFYAFINIGFIKKPIKWVLRKLNIKK